MGSDSAFGEKFYVVDDMPWMNKKIDTVIIDGHAVSIKRILLCLQKCDNLTDEALDANVIAVAIERMIQENERLGNRVDKKDMTFMGRKLWRNS